MVEFSPATRETGFDSPTMQEYFFLMIEEEKLLKKIFCIVGESNPGLPRGRREFYHWTNNACEWEESLDGCSVRKHSRWYSYKQNLFSQYFPATCIHLKPGNDYLEYDQEKSICFFCMKGSHFQLPLVCQQFCSVVVITFASHAKGPRFEPGQN